MPNHPYALSYGRRDSLPASHPSAPAPSSSDPPLLPPLVISHLAHPYSQQPSSAVGGSTVYESFLSPDTPEATIRVPSPVPSTIAGAQAYPPSQYDTLDTARFDETPESGLSHTLSASNSTTPLRRLVSPPLPEGHQYSQFK
ncbi:hypothetical protein M422DRAFT_44907 [Sphaerobolus stellatus SS14]|nr:hypothetical protein M422DRAFT_44907 [Sphaerobolus stellatus SS14]